MAVTEFMLRADPPMRLSMAYGWFTDVVVWLDQNELLRLPFAELRRKGEVELPLPDGSRLTVRSRGRREPALLIDGRPVADSVTDIQRRIARAGGALYAMAILHVCGLGVALRRDEEPSDEVMLQLLFAPGIYATAGLLAARGGLVGLIAAAAFFGVDTLWGFTNSTFTLRRWVVQILIRGAIAFALASGIAAALERRKAKPVTSPNS